MPKLRSPAELQSFADQKKHEFKVLCATQTRILVGMGTCGIAAGARDTLNAIQAELAKLQIHAIVTPVGCIGICVKEPLVDIQQAGMPRVTYANVMPEMVPRLLEEHLLKGKLVKEWAVGRLPTE